VVAYRELQTASTSLSPKEGQQMRLRFLDWLNETKLSVERVTIAPTGLSADEYDALTLNGVKILGMSWVAVPVNSIEVMAKGIQQKEKDRFTPKPRNTDRDNEIVHLHDVEKLGWKEITKRIRAVPEWANGPGGKQVTMRALKVAYSRRKKSKPQTDWSFRSFLTTPSIFGSGTEAFVTKSEVTDAFVPLFLGAFV